MLLPVSTEFVSLCRSQISLLTQGLGASLSVVYLTEDFAEGAEPNLVPVVAYPETLLRDGLTPALSPIPFEDARPALPLMDEADLALEDLGSETLRDADPSVTGERPLEVPCRVVLPLMHENVVMGLLVTAREERPWSSQERTQIEQVAQTLAAGCVLDRRSHWFQSHYYQQQDVQRQQHETLDTLVHQFRNPLTALRTFGKLLLRRLGTGDPNRDVASSIVRESDRLQELLVQIGQTLQPTPGTALPRTIAPSPGTEALEVPAQRAEQQEPLPQLLPSTGWLSAADVRPCGLLEVLEPLLMSTQAIAQERQITLHIVLPEVVQPVLANPKALREVLSNLLDNALKYTPPGGTVQLEVGAMRRTEAGPQQAIAITDTGPGIPLSDQGRIFERHYRGVQAQGSIPGSGLGLAIVKELIEQMQGSVEIHSPAIAPLWHPVADSSLHASGPLNPGERSAIAPPGTTLQIWLPIATPPPRPQ